MKTLSDVEKQIEVAKAVAAIEHFVKDNSYNGLIEELAEGNCMLLNQLADGSADAGCLSEVALFSYHYGEILKLIKPFYFVNGLL